MKRKPAKVGSVTKAGRWKRVAIPDSTKGVMMAKMRKISVWVWNGEEETKPVRAHLVIRKLEGQPKGKRFKYSLSNAAEGESIQRLAYKQSQRFWVEKAIKDCKDGLGIDEYQTRGWRAWHHHIALTILAGLFLMKLKREHGEALPLLSLYDLKEVLRLMLPLKKQSVVTVWMDIFNRHRRRTSAKRSAYRRQRSRPPT
jgi:hypothetical protein